MKMKPEGKGGYWKLIIAGGGVAALLAVTLFLPPSIFRFREVVILGKPARLSELDLVKRMGVERGSSLLTLRLAPIRENLLKFPWIDQVTLAKAYPGRLIVSLREQEPVVLVERGGLYLVNRRGELFKKVASGDPRDFPVVTGWRDPQRDLLLSFIRIAESFQERELLRTVGLSEIHWDEKQGATLYTMRPVIKVALGQKEWERRLEKLEQILPEVGRDKGRPLSIDLTYAKRVFVKTQS